MTSFPVGVRTMPLAKPMLDAAVVKIGTPPGEEKLTSVTQDKGKDPNVSRILRNL